MNGDLGAKLDEILKNPEMLSQIKALADTMTSAEKPSEPPPPSSQEPAIPPEVLPAFLAPSGELERNLANTQALLLALKPFLDERRCMKIDKMLSMMRLARLAGRFGELAR